jgi:hypothetical protein
MQGSGLEGLEKGVADHGGNIAGSIRPATRNSDFVSDFQNPALSFANFASLSFAEINCRIGRGA